MSSVIVIIDLVTQIIQKLNVSVPQALTLYRSLAGMVKGGGGDPLPDLADSAVIDLLKQRADRGVAWADEELAKLP